jgi:hypothetical protein
VFNNLKGLSLSKDIFQGREIKIEAVQRTCINGSQNISDDSIETQGNGASGAPPTYEA